MKLEQAQCQKTGILITGESLIAIIITQVFLFSMYLGKDNVSIFKQKSEQYMTLKISGNLCNCDGENQL